MKHVRITKANDRGFHDYGKPMVDLYGIQAVVRESSLATEPAVWIFLEATPSAEAGNLKPEQLHLNEKGAKELIRRLQTWIDEIPKRWGR